MSHLLPVVVATPAHAGLGAALTYEHPEVLAPGTLVRVPLGKREVLGVVWAGAWTAALWALQPMAWLLGEMAAWPMASVSLPMPPLGLSVLALLGATAWVLPLPLSWRLLCLPLLWPVLLWEQPRPASGQFELLAADGVLAREAVPGHARRDGRHDGRHDGRLEAAA
mgnify:CR=1 FL=1